MAVQLWLVFVGGLVGLVGVSGEMGVNHAPPSLYSCIDWECTEWISQGRTMLRYLGKTDKHLSFGKNQHILIISKPVDKNGPDWVGKVGNKVGLVPKDMVREDRVNKSPTKFKLDLQEVLEVVGLAEGNGEETKEQNEEEDGEGSKEELESNEVDGVEIEDVDEVENKKEEINISGVKEEATEVTSTDPLQNEVPTEVEKPEEIVSSESSFGDSASLENIPPPQQSEVDHNVSLEGSGGTGDLESDQAQEVPFNLNQSDFSPEQNLEEGSLEPLSFSSDVAPESSGSGSGVNLQPSTDTVLQGSSTILDEYYLTETPKTEEVAAEVKASASLPVEDQITPRIPEALLTSVMSEGVVLQGQDELAQDIKATKVQNLGELVGNSTPKEEETQFTTQPQEEMTRDPVIEGSGMSAGVGEVNNKTVEEIVEVVPEKVEVVQPHKLTEEKTVAEDKESASDSGGGEEEEDVELTTPVPPADEGPQETSFLEDFGLVGSQLEEKKEENNSSSGESEPEVKIEELEKKEEVDSVPAAVAVPEQVFLEPVTEPPTQEDDEEAKESLSDTFAAVSQELGQSDSVTEQVSVSFSSESVSISTSSDEPSPVSIPSENATAAVFEEDKAIPEAEHQQEEVVPPPTPPPEEAVTDKQEEEPLQDVTPEHLNSTEKATESASVSGENATVEEGQLNLEPTPPPEEAVPEVPQEEPQVIAPEQLNATEVVPPVETEIKQQDQEELVPKDENVELTTVSPVLSEVPEQVIPTEIPIETQEPVQEIIPEGVNATMEVDPPKEADIPFAEVAPAPVVESTPIIQQEEASIVTPIENQSIPDSSQEIPPEIQEPVPVTTEKPPFIDIASITPPPPTEQKPTEEAKEPPAPVTEEPAQSQPPSEEPVLSSGQEPETEEDHGHHHHQHHHHRNPKHFSKSNWNASTSNSSSIILVIKHLSSTLLSFLPEALQDTILDVDDALVFTGIIALTLVSICVPYFLIEGYMSVRPLKKKVNELNKSLWKVSAAYETQQEEFELYKRKAMAHDEFRKRAEQSENDVVILKELEKKQREQITKLKGQLKLHVKEAIDIKQLIQKTLRDKKEVELEVVTWKEETEKMKDQVKNMKEELVKAQKIGKASKVQLENWSRNKELMESKVELLEREVEEVKRQLEVEGDRRKEGEREVLKLKEEKGELERELENVKRICGEYETTVDRLNGEIGKLESELETIKESLGEDSPLLEIAEVQAKAQFCEKEATSLRMRLEGICEDNERLRQKLKEKEGELVEVKGEKEETRKRLEVLEGYFKEREEQLLRSIEVLQQKELVRDKGKDELLELLEEKEETVKKLEETLEGLKDELEERKVYHRNEIRSLEAKGHENWLSLCQAERKAQDARKEAELLRQKLTKMVKEREVEFEEDEGEDLEEDGLGMVYHIPHELVPPPILDEEELEHQPSYFGLGDFVPPPPLEDDEGEVTDSRRRPAPLGGTRLSPSLSDDEDDEEEDEDLWNNNERGSSITTTGSLRPREEEGCTDGSSGSASPPLRAGGWVAMQQGGLRGGGQGDGAVLRGGAQGVQNQTGVNL